MDALIEDASEEVRPLKDEDVPHSPVIGGDGRGHARAASADNYQFFLFHNHLLASLRMFDPSLS